MPELIDSPVHVEAAGQPPKTIEEFTGRASTGEQRASVARMRSPTGWAAPGVRRIHRRTRRSGALGALEVAAGQGVLVRTGEWVRYSTQEGAEYISVCLPAFWPDAVHRAPDAAIRRRSWPRVPQRRDSPRRGVVDRVREADRETVGEIVDCENLFRRWAATPVARAPLCAAVTPRMRRRGGRSGE